MSRTSYLCTPHPSPTKSAAVFTLRSTGIVLPAYISVAAPWFGWVKLGG